MTTKPRLQAGSPGWCNLADEVLHSHNYTCVIFQGLQAAMTALKWTAAALMTLFAFPAHADVSGPACVTDGDTLVVNGKRQRTRCVGGTRVRLLGIDAPGDCVTVPTANDPT